MPETYSGCANPDNASESLWCPTETKLNGVYISGSGKWGYCKMEDEGGHCTSSGMCGILHPLIILFGQGLDIECTNIRQSLDLVSNLIPTNYLPGPGMGNN